MDDRRSLIIVSFVFFVVKTRVTEHM